MRGPIPGRCGWPGALSIRAWSGPQRRLTADASSVGRYDRPGVGHSHRRASQPSSQGSIREAAERSRAVVPRRSAAALEGAVAIQERSNTDGKLPNKGNVVNEIELGNSVTKLTLVDRL